LKERIKLNLEQENKFTQTQQAFLDMIKPKVFYGVDSAEIEHEKDFEALCNRIAPHTNKDIKLMSVFEFYSLIDYIKDGK
jgi:hypothetical protein